MFIAKTPQRNVGEKELLMVLQDAVRHVCGKPAWSNCIYLNVVTCPFAGQVFGKTDDSTFAGVIANGWKFRRSSAESCNRSDIDDLSPALPNHDLAHRLCAEKRSSQIGLDYLIPILKTHLLRRSTPGYAGVIDQDVDL